jgi:peptide/nickel transport system ATP-binding protein
MSAPVLEVEGLSVGIPGLALVEGVGFSVVRGEVLAVVGESGSGKSLTGLALMGLLAWPVGVTAGRIRLNGQEIQGAPAATMRRLRGREIAMIFQDPMMTLNPVMRVDEQMVEAIRVHDRSVPRRDALLRAREALETVGIQAPEERLLAYPHELSGGMRQRIVIATALLNRPAVVIADEPTTALDVTTQAQILHEVRRLARVSGCAMLWITHDLAVVANLADRIAVMYAGRIVEQGPAEQVLARPLHPYTQGLMESVPLLEQRRRRLRSIPGLPPSAGSITQGCRFAPRCERRSAACAEEPALSTPEPGRLVRCIHPLSEAVPA